MHTPCTRSVNQVAWDKATCILATDILVMCSCMFYTYIKQIKLSTGQWKTAIHFALTVVKPCHVYLYISMVAAYVGILVWSYQISGAKALDTNMRRWHVQD